VKREDVKLRRDYCILPFLKGVVACRRAPRGRYPESAWKKKPSSLLGTRHSSWQMFGLRLLPWLSRGLTSSANLCYLGIRGLW
jgi:hypothetical protein